jgi:hypothetical protein
LPFDLHPIEIAAKKRAGAQAEAIFLQTNHGVAVNLCAFCAGVFILRLLPQLNATPLC